MLRPATLLPTAAAAALLAACAGARPTTGAAASVPPGTTVATTGAPASAAPDSARRGYVAADVRFMQDMIAHHAQALAMVAMVPTHGAGDDVRLAAERIDVTQRDEIALMQRWLRRRGEAAPEPGAAHAHHGAGVAMPGMLTPTELARLDAARGAEFDRLFLASMIRHHEGALAMVRAYHATPGAAQETEIFRFSSDVDADQRAEIRRMRTLLDRMAP